MAMSEPSGSPSLLTCSRDTSPARWEKAFASELSSNTVTVGILGDGRIEVTFDSADDTSWGERLDIADSNEVAFALLRGGVGVKASPSLWTARRSRT